VLEVMLEHSRGQGEMHRGRGSHESVAVMYADKIGYVWADVNDVFVRLGVNIHSYPELAELVGLFGPNQRSRVRKCVEALCLESAEAGTVVFESSEVARNFQRVKRLMHTVYGPQNFNDFALLERAY